jgi:hypothetical protein
MGLRSDTGSVAFWMNMSEVVGGINTIWWGGDNTTGGGMGPENEMHIHIETVVTNIWIGGELCFRVLHGPLIHLHSDPEKGDASVPGDPPVNPVLMNDGQWHHVVGTWGDADGNVNLYLDGNLLQQATQHPVIRLATYTWARWQMEGELTPACLTMCRFMAAR